MMNLDTMPALDTESPPSTLGEALGVAALVSVPSGLIVAWATHQLQVPVVVANAASLALVAGTAGALLRGLRPAPLAVRAAVWAALLAVLPLSLFGRLLSAGTHHRPLGAVTFAIVALGVLAASLLVALRLALPVGDRAEPSALQRVLWRLMQAAASLGALVALLGAFRSGATELLPQLIALGVVFFAASRPGWSVTPRRPALGWLCWLLMVGAGEAVLHFSVAGASADLGATLLMSLIP